jgi:hypothetical protein
MVRKNRLGCHAGSKLAPDNLDWNPVPRITGFPPMISGLISILSCITVPHSVRGGGLINEFMSKGTS